jgi:hypothetical protein
MGTSRFRLLEYLAQLIKLDESLSRMESDRHDPPGRKEAQDAIRVELGRVLGEVPAALQNSPAKVTADIRRPPLERWFLVYRPRSKTAWILHALFYAFCTFTAWSALELGYSGLWVP